MLSPRAPLFSVGLAFALGCLLGLDNWISLRVALVALTVAGAAWWPLDHFKVSTPEIDHDAPIAVHCKGGYRSAIACSLLLRAGFKSVSNVSGGFDAWQQAKLPFVSEKPVGA